MSPAAFICTTPVEKENDLQGLGGYLASMGYDAYFYPELCSPRGQVIMRGKIGEEDKVILICARKLGREVFEGTLTEDAEFFSYDMQGEPKELASLIHEEVTLFPSEKVLVPKPVQEVLIIGGGVSGVYAALDLAEQGHKVYLVEKDPSIGGIMAALDKTFPTMDCSI
jgi:heterodisulfide reductase subunit A-like polyferredoxin